MVEREWNECKGGTTVTITTTYDTIQSGVNSGYYRCYSSYKKDEKMQYLVQNNIDVGGVIAYYVDSDRCVDILYGEQVLLEIAQLNINGMDNRAWTITYVNEEQYNDLIRM